MIQGKKFPLPMIETSLKPKYFSTLFSLLLLPIMLEFFLEKNHVKIFVVLNSQVAFLDNFHANQVRDAKIKVLSSLKHSTDEELSEWKKLSNSLKVMFNFFV